MRLYVKLRAAWRGERDGGRGQGWGGHGARGS